MSFEDALKFGALYRAGKQCFKGIRWKDSTVGYESNIMKNTYQLQQDLMNGKYKISPYQKFTIHEPKQREIVATRIKDRQFQRSLCDNGFYEDITKSFIRDNCACQRGRGIDDAINRLSVHLQKYNREHGKEGWVLALDIHHYFNSIDHDVAKSAVSKRCTDTKIVKYVYDIIDSFGDVGLGLGSQISQLIALAVLDDLDHYIKERLHIKHYVRYMDDLVLIHEDKEYLTQCLRLIESELSKIRLKTNKKTTIYPLRQGVKFLKWRYIITDSGRIVMKMQKEKLGKERRHLKKVFLKELNGEYEKGTAQTSLICWLANAKRGDTFFVRQRMWSYFNGLEDTYVQHLQKNSDYGTEASERAVEKREAESRP